MGYEESLRQARDLLAAEIKQLKEQLDRKEASLRKLESFLKEPYKQDGNGESLTQQIVELVYTLVERENKPVSAKMVIKEFYKNRNDVNESTIRSTLYQVTRKQKPTEVKVDGGSVWVRVLKDGPLYDIRIPDEKASGGTQA